MLRPKILVAVCSCQKEKDRRQAVRDTWASDIPEGIKVVFFLGGTEEGEADEWVLPVGDTYEDLTLKSRAMLEQAMAEDFDWLFKCDNDTYVKLSRLHSLVPPPGWDLVGNEFLLDQQFASGGAGYLLSRKAVEAVLGDDSKSHFRQKEDVSITQTAIQNGMGYLASYRLKWHTSPCPLPDNDIITCHHLDVEAMHQIHNRFL